MKKTLKVIGVLVASFALVFGVIEVGSSLYNYYVSKGFKQETSALLVFFGLAISLFLGAVGVNHVLDKSNP